MHEAGLDEQLAVEEVGELAPDRRRHRQRQQRRGDDPRVGGLAAAEVADDPRQRGRDDRARQDRDEHAEQQARTSPRAPRGGSCAARASGRAWRLGRLVAVMRRAPGGSVPMPPPRSPRAAVRAAWRARRPRPPTSRRARSVAVAPCGGASRSARARRPAVVAAARRGGRRDRARARRSRPSTSAATWRLATDRSTLSCSATSLTRTGSAAMDHGERREPLRAQLGERVARDRALDQTQPVERDDEIFGR